VCRLPVKRVVQNEDFTFFLLPISVDDVHKILVLVIRLIVLDCFLS